MKEFKKTINNICTSRRESTLEQSIEMLGVSVDDFINQRFIRDKIKGETKELKKKFKIY